MPNVSMPDMDINLKRPNVKGDVDVSVPAVGGDIEVPKVNIEGPELDIESPSGKIKGPKFNMPKISGPKISMPDMDLNLRGHKLKGDVDVSIPKVEGNIKGSKLDIGAPKIDIESSSGKIKGPSFNMPKISGPSISMPDVDLDVSMPKIKGDMKTSGVDIEGPDFNIKGLEGGIEKPKMKTPSFDLQGPKFSGPTITSEGGSGSLKGVSFPKFKGPKFGMKHQEVTFPATEGGLEARESDIHIKGKKGKFKFPQGKVKAKNLDVDITPPAVDMDLDTPHIHVKGTKGKKPLFGKLHFPDVELDIKSPKLKGDGYSTEGLKSPGIDLPTTNLSTNTSKVSLEGPDVNLKAPNIKVPKVSLSAPDIDVDLKAKGGVTIPGGFKGLHYPDGAVTFPKMRVPKFGILQPQMEGQTGGVNVKSELGASGGVTIQPPSVGLVNSPDTEISSPEVRHSEGRVKVKMPKIFVKSKAKGSSVGDLRGPEVVSTDPSVNTGDLNLALQGDTGLSASSKGKSASLDLFKKSRHRSSSLSDEEGVGGRSPSTQLEAAGGDISLDLGGGKVKGKKGKLKFGTFGGFGSKSKGSYEVTLGEDSEARVEGSAGVSLPSKKSRLSSSSSSDSGSRGGFRFPRLELSVSPKK